MPENSEPKTNKTVSVPSVADVAAGDTIRLRKPHPCGGYDWRVVRIGADIGLRCLKCDHRVNLPRAEFERRFKTFLARATGSASNPETGKD